MQKRHLSKLNNFNGQESDLKHSFLILNAGVTSNHEKNLININVHIKLDRKFFPLPKNCFLWQVQILELMPQLNDHLIILKEETTQSEKIFTSEALLDFLVIRNPNYSS